MNSTRNMIFGFALGAPMALINIACSEDTEPEKQSDSTKQTATASILAETSEELSGDNCSEGGTRISIGVDDGRDDAEADNGRLEEAEILSESFVCSNPASTEIPKVLVMVADEPEGENCAHGGHRIDSGLDENEDGELQESEIHSTSYACFPEPAAGAGGAGGASTESGHEVVVDGNGKVLGTAVEWNLIRVIIETPEGYWFKVPWNGDLDTSTSSSTVFFEGVDCTGAAWASEIWDGTAGAFGTAGQLLHEQELYYERNSDQFYRLSDTTGGYATAETFVPLSRARHTQQDCIGAGSPSPGPDFEGWALEPVARSVVGVPDNIVGPLSLR